jgi:hypothetical protein
MSLYPHRSGCYYCYRTCNISCKVLKSARNFGNRLVIYSYWRHICLPCLWKFWRNIDPDIFGNQCHFWYMSEFTCNCINYCYCSESEGDINHDYPNLSIHCDCRSPLDSLETPTSNCNIEQFDMCFNCVEEPDCIICAPGHLDRHSLISQYLHIKM